MADIDRTTIEKLGLPGRVLMESAGRAVAACCLQSFPEAERITVVCGPGNNGGDGFVVARTLADRGLRVSILTVATPDRYRGDALDNYRTAEAWGLPIFLLGEEDADLIGSADILVDALFGTGLSRAVEGPCGDLIDRLNASRCPIVAVDIPSGIDSATGQVLGRSVRAALTVTFGLPKVGLLLEPGASYAGALTLADIGFPRTLLESSELPGHLLEEDFVKGLLPSRPANAHKASCGRAVLVAGSRRYPGAAGLAGLGALRGGAGLVYLCVPNDVQAWIEPRLLEAIVVGSRDEDVLEPLLASAQGVCVGPGLHEGQEGLVKRVLASSTCPVVLDADGLRALPCAAGDLIITPHPGEMARLLGTTVAAVESDRVGAARKAAETFGCVAVLKGAPTLVATPDGRFWVNTSGGPVLAQGGTGDVLSGLLTALVAQGLTSLDAALSGVFLHGRAGDVCQERLGPRGVLAHEVADALPGVVSRLLQGPSQ